MMAPPWRASYGVDAPSVLLLLGVLAVGYLAAALVVALFQQLRPSLLLLLIGVVLAGQFGLLLHATRRGKFRVWAGLLDDLELRGDERLLDMGCGRGAVLLAAARRLPAGRAVGLDVWCSADHCGNTPATAEQNALAENVADRIELRTGDMTRMPFPDGAFDVVVSSLAIHNIRSAEGRAAAVNEACRVLRPGGKLVIVDIGKTREYRAVLAANGATALTFRPVGWRMWWGGPWVPTHALTAVAPG
ncbi:class I SAM-dependent methyltransferase [Nocardia abscessus]|uniref:class I SAM-dependent methyltransferase n=1 Tax=Nocardia abscessus TaxID=120957 RepID=UPI0024558694|nr:class I SAM-dependent methyltransferase [Nocardia abscessus]